MKDGYPKESRIPIIEIPGKLYLFDKRTNSRVYQGPNWRIIKIYQDPSEHWIGTSVDKLIMYQEATNFLSTNPKLNDSFGTIVFANQIEMEVFMIVHPLDVLAMTSKGIVYADVEEIGGPSLSQAHKSGNPASLSFIENDYQLGYKAYQDMQTDHTKRQFQTILQRAGNKMIEITGYDGIDITTMSNIKPRFYPQLDRVDLIVTDICSDINNLRQANLFE